LDEDLKPQGGGEYLALCAKNAGTAGMPYAQAFQWMLRDLAHVQDEPPLLGGEVVMARPPWDEEKTPQAIVNVAAGLAIDYGDTEGLNEVLQLGLSLLAKWPSYLCQLTDGHPHMQMKVASEDTRSAESYLEGFAEAVIEGGPGGREYGSAFASLIAAGGLNEPVQRDSAEWDELVDLEQVARRALTVNEVHAMSAITAAHDRAIAEGNLGAAKEIVHLGLILFARWQDYVALMSAESETDGT
jgi:hypothetical protein